MSTVLHKRKNALLIIISLFIFSLIIVNSYDYTFLKIGGGIIILCLPYIIPLVFLGGGEKKVKYLDPLWVKVIFLLLFLIYVACSTSWASSMLNSVFHVSSSNFPITLALINIAYLPYNFFSYLINYFYIALIIGAPFLFLFLFNKVNIFKIIFLLFILACYIGVSIANISFIRTNKDHLIKVLALKMDFDQYNSCIGLQDKNYRVVNIGDNHVILYDGHLPINHPNQFRTTECKIMKDNF
ncbi:MULTISPECIES: hypothetical protein [Acinetobacter calcoaceticus/baumannii complex]|uniref:hypothetical protein n=1 Tax=Acinetobacter calcoaceticus/baumannii complex TaxID=909768 RepID=UPI000DE6DA63|nr:MULTISPECIES: hypothetical protein [Acinetobacter calcoaceticus/baumannii complex]MEB6625845.1 hypothetical protein [Acinetobacter pittii]RKL59903.1 hypothetical protein CKN54_07000 [Acinetobacter baumannii]WPQ49063.1 hypothetical protein SLP98_00525 [Acinetobacter baumannii]SSR05113.1 Uncharacterised protein [Acinetobacter baumannii]